MPATIDFFCLFRQTPRVSDVQLSVVKKSGGIVDVKVSYKLNLSAVERNMKGLLFREQIMLKGSDPVGGTGSSAPPDDHLYTLRCVSFPTEDKAVIQREVTKTLASDYLDEDKNALDEVYAQVIVTPMLPQKSSGRSKTVTGYY